MSGTVVQLGKARIYLTWADLVVLRLVYPDGNIPPFPTFFYLTPRVGRAYASCLRRWVDMNPDHPESTVAAMLAGDMETLEVTR